MTKKKKTTKSKSSSKKLVKKTTKPKPIKTDKSKKSVSTKKAISILALILIIVVLAVVGYTKLSDIKDNTAVAFINDEKITTEELDKSYNFLFFLTGYPEEYKQIITKEIYLEQLIDEKILIQAAEKQNFVLDENELNKKIQEMMDQNLLTEEQFKDRLNEGGFSFDYFKDYYRTQLMLADFLNETLLSKVEVTDSEAGEYYEDNKENYTAKEGEIRARHILVETEEEAIEILKEIRKGVDFAELAKTRSIGPSSVKGGDLGIFGRGTMIKEFEEAAFALRIGEVSEPVQTEYGWHIIKRDSGVISYEEVQDQIKEILLLEKQKQTFGEYLDGLKEESEIIINLDGIEMPVGLVVENTCIDDYGISKDTIIFYHATWCPHCQDMMPIVRDLENEGYKFFWAESSSKDSSIIVDCFREVIQGGVPEFICAGTNEFELGAMSKGELKKFADKCRS
ncbi:peptidylprolyl isomerase [Candidatus Woesearchaeota archaeon]|nr:peptidylprolyl isomerase [Candidatus Woesearchaeota archaeon]